MNYTRKRALLACDFCRHRKRRCDGQKPCSTCRDSNADCVYKELPYERIEDASPAAVVDRLARIEALLEQQSQQLHQLSSSSTPTTTSVAAFDYAQSPVFPQVSEFVEPSQMTILEDGSESPTFLIPKGHTTLATTLLSVPKIRDVLGDYPRDFFYSVEENQPLPEPLRNPQRDRRGWPPLRQNVLNKLSDNYFLHVHPHHPLFSRNTFRIWQAKLLKKEPVEDAAAAICLCVYALGAITSPQASAEMASDEVLGMGFFRPALAIVLHEYTWNFKPDLAICQALLLAGSYFSHLGRPLHSWRMAFFASQRFLNFMEFRREQDHYAECTEGELRVFWQCFLEDCDRAEDLDIMRSGIEPLGDKMPLPHSLDPSDQEETIHFIAEIAIRRLLNRVHSSLYSPNTDPAETMAWPGQGLAQGSSGTTLSLPRLLALSAELDRQLEQWYASMPEGVRPPRGTEPISCERGHVLRIRYYAARAVIHRPFVLYAMAHQQQQQQQQQGAGMRRVSSASSPSPSSGGPQPPSRHLSVSTASISSASSPTPPAAPATSSPLPPIVAERCEVCVAACTTYLRNAVIMLERRTPYLWTLAQNCMACLLVLMMAEGCGFGLPPAPPPTASTPDPAAPRTLEALRDVVVARLRRWAVEGSSFEAELTILERLAGRDGGSSSSSRRSNSSSGKGLGDRDPDRRNR